MAIKNTKSKKYDRTYEEICTVLRDPDYAKLIQVEFVEEALLSGAVEFRYCRKTNLKRYGRNYFIKVQKISDNETNVAVTTQSRKVTVLLDVGWEFEVERVFNIMEIMLKK